MSDVRDAGEDEGLARDMDKLRETMTPPDRTIEGERATYVVVPDHWKDEVWLLAVFDDNATYEP